MTTNSFTRLMAGVAAVSLLAAAGAAAAQTAAPAAAAAPEVKHGPALANVCVFSNERAGSTSAVGKYAIDRIKQLETAATAEITAETRAFDTDAKAFQAQQATLSAEAKTQKSQVLQQRYTALQRKAQVRQQELEVTQRKAGLRIDTEMRPIVLAIYQQRNCSMLLDRNAILAANPAMDITDTVIQQLNAKITNFPFEREHLEQQAAAGAAASAAAKPPVKKN